MAEFVGRRMESKIPYLELLALTELFTVEELKPIIQDLSSHEYRVQKKLRTVENVIQYVQAHMDLLSEIRERREERNYFHKTNEIEEVIKTEISSLLAVNFSKFCNRLDYWSTRINFAKAQGWNSAVRKLYEQATKILGKQYPQLWIEASNFEWGIRPNHIQIARKILQLGLRDNKTSEALYVAAFRLEVDYVKYLEEHPLEMKKILDTPNGDLIANKLVLAKLIYEAACKNCKPSKNFFLKFYLTLQELDTAKTKDLVSQITNDAESSPESLNVTSQLDPLETVEYEVMMQLQNFSLFLPTYTDILKLLKEAKEISKPEFWTNICHLIHLNGIKLNMKQWFDVSNVPTQAEIKLCLRLWVLNFYSLSDPCGTLKQARQWYDKVKQMIPSFPDIHLRMAFLELCQHNIDHDRVRKCYNNAILWHGKQCLEAWLQYIQYEKKFFPQGDQSAKLFARALFELDSTLQEEFKIAMLKNNK